MFKISETDDEQQLYTWITLSNGYN